MKDRTKFIIKLIIFIIIIFIIISMGLYIVTQIPNTKFKTSYQYAVNRKYHTLINTDSPKIIIVGGSNAGFGINKEIIKEKTGMNVVNMGLHAGFGTYFCTEIAKANIQKGDIIVLAYETGFYTGDYGETELIVTGIDNNLELYKYICNKKFNEIGSYIPTYIFKKLDRNSERQTGTYSIDSFDEEGNMILERPNCVLPEEISDYYGAVNLSEISLNNDIITYINDFYKYCKGKGADVVITFPPTLDERMLSTEQEMTQFEDKLQSNLLPKVISKCKDYVFSREYMYDTIYHCNDFGEKIRSEKLANDINNYIE